MSHSKFRKNSALQALTAAAMALPGLANAAVPTDQTTVSYRYSVYDEEDIDESAVIGTETERYNIDINQFYLLTPLGDKAEFSLELAHEKMSGATPWFILPGENNQPLQIMSGATIEDTRRDLLVSGKYFFEETTIAISAGVSKEDDYLAHNFGIEGQFELNDKHTTVTVGLGFSNDKIQPTDADIFPLRPVREDKESVTLVAGVGQVLNPRATVQTSLSVSRLTGFLSDPYKQVFVENNVLADSRPDDRTQWVWLTRYRYYVEKMDAALHVDYRFYTDNWSLTSHTVETSWYQNLPQGWRVTPTLRYYSQESAEFYAPFFTETRTDGFHSSDYRLSGYGAFSARLQLSKTWNDWTFSVNVERYLSDGDYGFNSDAVENPALLDFTTITAGIDVKF